VADQIAGLVLQAARLLFRPGDVVELRVFNARQFGTISGYFDDLEALAKAAAYLDKQQFPGVYWTLNPLHSDLLARASNKTRRNCKPGELTGDDHVLCVRWLYIDLDPKRPVSGISATDEEKATAMELAPRIRDWLKSEGWPDPIEADSGNGAHLLYRIVELPNEPASEALLDRVLAALGARFDTDVVKVDQTTKNPSRICKIYGTVARKGDNVPARPHRLSSLLQIPAEVVPVPIELLQRLAAMAPKEATTAPRSGARSPQRQYTGPKDFDVAGFLSKYGIRHRAAVPHEGGYKYVLEECPFDSSHKAPDSAVFDRPDGLGFLCFHNSCKGRDWREFRELFEPDAYAPRSYPRSAQRPPEPPLPPEPADLVKPPVQSGATAPDLVPDVEAPIILADVEAAADLAIENKSSAEVMRLAVSVAALRTHEQAIIVGKLRDGLKDEWKSLEKWFEKALRDAVAERRGEAPAGDVPGQNPPAEPPAGGDAAGETPDLLGYPLTDSGNGQRIVAMFGRDIRYCTEMESWLIWDGKRWAVDHSNVMRHKAMEMAREMYVQCLRLPDGARRGAASKHALQSESSRGITNALTEAQRMPGIAVSANDLDQYPDHFNLLNGTLHLRDGKMKPHDSTMLLTKLCEHNYRPNAKCPLFQGFVEWTMGGPIDGGSDTVELSEITVRLVGFIQRVLGYSITGNVSAKAVFVFFGPDGNNGKTTLLTLIRELLGRDYASLLLIETIMHARSTDNTAREDMADLRGTRFVQTSEISKEDRLNEQRVKFLTQGMGTIKSRRLHEHLIEFTATHKLLMDCNYRPKVGGQDNAIWNRLIQIPFDYTVPENRLDLNLREKLHAEAEGIIAWLVRGAIDWYQHGLGKPPEVVEAGLDWRENDDPLREFLTDWCKVGPDLFCTVKDLMTAYLLWAKDYGEKFPLARRAFNEALIGKGITQDRVHSGRRWVGVELKPEIKRNVGGDEPPLPEQQF
jgi:P4 family phage/plasmid primase-like protien